MDFRLADLWHFTVVLRLLFTEKSVGTNKTIAKDDSLNKWNMHNLLQKEKNKYHIYSGKCNFYYHTIFL